MKLVGKVHKFNTRRMYAANGQEIVWAVIELDDEERSSHTRQVVVFIDRARGIDGIIDLHLGNLDLVDDEWVLRAYDDHHWRGYEYRLLEFVRQAVKEAGL